MKRNNIFFHSFTIAAHSAYDIISLCSYLIVNLIFPAVVFGVGNSFLLLQFLIITFMLFARLGYLIFANIRELAAS